MIKLTNSREAKESIKMNISSTISALNKITADVKKLNETMTSAAELQEITPQHLIQALDILTTAYNQMNGEQFTVSMNQGENDSPSFKGYIPESAQNYWLEKFQIMRQYGWCRLWSSVSGQTREQYATGILTFFKQYKAGKAHKIKLSGNMREVTE